MIRGLSVEPTTGFELRLASPAAGPASARHLVAPRGGPTRRFEDAGADPLRRDSNCAWLRQSPVPLRRDRGSASASEASGSILLRRMRQVESRASGGPTRRFEGGGADPLDLDANCAWLRQSPVPLRRDIQSRLGRSHSQVRILIHSRKMAPASGGHFSGANYRIRTCDLLITNQLLYQLS